MDFLKIYIVFTRLLTIKHYCAKSQDAVKVLAVDPSNPQNDSVGTDSTENHVSQELHIPEKLWDEGHTDT